MMKWTIIVLIGALALMFSFNGLAPASDNAQDNPNNIKKTSPQSGDSQNSVINKTQNALDKAVTKTESAVKKGARKTGNFFKRVGNKVRNWFD